ncbi:Uncharacterised protein [Mycobacterium tuberculosis]|nr:Uncharacterised protein [Mycobacterium tuberculosis]
MAVLQPGDDTPIGASKPCALGCAVAESPLCDRRRMPLLPWCFRLECGDGTAPFTTAVRALLCAPDGDLRQRDNGLAGRDGCRPDRPAGRGGHRGRLTPGGSHGGIVGARAAVGCDRRARRPGATLRRCRGGPGDGRPDRRGSADLDVRPIAARGGTDCTGCPGATGRHCPGTVGHGGVVSGRLSCRGP